METEVTCYGISCADVLIQGLDLQAPFREERRLVEQISMGVGGDATNQAMILAKLGASVKLVSGLGTDNVGLFIQNIVASAGVDVSCIARAESPSVISVVVIDETGQRNIIHANLPECTHYVPDLNAMRGSKIVSIGSIHHPPFDDVEQIIRVAKAAKEQGSIVCADVIARNSNHRLEFFGEALQYIDYIFPNESEAAMLTGKTDVSEIADAFLRYGVGNVVIKVGEKGCIAKNAGGMYAFPAIGNCVVDTTGAGDNFAAGFMRGLLDGKDLAGCCEFAAGTAGIAISVVGANTGVKSYQQVNQFISEHRSK